MMRICTKRGPCRPLSFFICLKNTKLVPENKVHFNGEWPSSFLIVLPPVWKSDVKCTRISGIFNKSNLVMENGLFPVIRASQASCPCSRSHSRSDSGASRLVRLDCDLDLQAFSRSSSIFARVRWRAQGLRCQFRGPATTAHGYTFGSRESFGDSCLGTGEKPFYLSYAATRWSEASNGVINRHGCRHLSSQLKRKRAVHQEIFYNKFYNR